MYIQGLVNIINVGKTAWQERAASDQHKKIWDVAHAVQKTESAAKAILSVMASSMKHRLRDVITTVDAAPAVAIK